MATKLSDSARIRLTEAVRAVCRKAGIDPTGAELLRYTMNAVYRIDDANIVIRMNTGPDAATLAARVASVAAMFAELDLPTTRLAPGITQPVHVDGWSATFWILLPQPPDHRFDPADLAAPLRAIHRVATLPTPLPRWNPVGKARRRLASATAHDGAARDHLCVWAESLVGVPLDAIADQLNTWCDDLDRAIAKTEWTLTESVIHADAHAGNLLSDLKGGVVLGDLDSVAIGPPEWDLTPAAHGVARFGDDRQRYQDFADAYGLDVTCCPAWETLRQIRELQLLTSVIANLGDRPQVAHQLAHRVRTALDGDRLTRWRRYQ